MSSGFVFTFTVRAQVSLGCCVLMFMTAFCLAIVHLYLESSLLWVTFVFLVIWSLLQGLYQSSPDNVTSQSTWLLWHLTGGMFVMGYIGLLIIPGASYNDLVPWTMELPFETYHIDSHTAVSQLRINGTWIFKDLSFGNFRLAEANNWSYSTACYTLFANDTAPDATALACAQWCERHLGTRAAHQLQAVGYNVPVYKACFKAASQVTAATIPTVAVYIFAGAITALSSSLAWAFQTKERPDGVFTSKNTPATVYGMATTRLKAELFALAITGMSSSIKVGLSIITVFGFFRHGQPYFGLSMVFFISLSHHFILQLDRDDIFFCFLESYRLKWWLHSWNEWKGHSPELVRVLFADSVRAIFSVMILMFSMLFTVPLGTQALRTVFLVIGLSDVLNHSKNMMRMEYKTIDKWYDDNTQGAWIKAMEISRFFAVNGCIVLASFVYGDGLIILWMFLIWFAFTCITRSVQIEEDGHNKWANFFTACCVWLLLAVSVYMDSPRSLDLMRLGLVSQLVLLFCLAGSVACCFDALSSLANVYDAKKKKQAEETKARELDYDLMVEH